MAVVRLAHLCSQGLQLLRLQWQGIKICATIIQGKLKCLPKNSGISYQELNIL
jgi:hypothetical protein